MRADRLVAALLLMQSRGRVTAGELSDELEVSIATARRDLEALSAAGIPVYPQAGRGGGWSLLGGGRTDLSGLTSSEAQALFLLVGPAASVNPEAKSALRKLVRALPDTFRPDAEAASNAMVFDSSRWGGLSRDTPPLVGVLQGAIVSRLRVELLYANWDSDPTSRLVSPLGLVEKNAVWYLIALTDRGQRTYRMDRVRSASVTEELFERPAEFDLATAWESTVAEVEEQRGSVIARLAVTPEIVPYLRTTFGQHCVVLPDGEVTVAAPTLELLTRFLAGWADSVTVVSPPELATALAALGGALVERHSTR